MPRDTYYRKCITIPSPITTIITLKSMQHVDINRDSNSQFFPVFTTISFALKNKHYRFFMRELRLSKLHLSAQCMERLLGQPIIGQGEARCVNRAHSGLTLHNLGGNMASSPKNSTCSHFLKTNILLHSWLTLMPIVLCGPILFDNLGVFKTNWDLSCSIWDIILALCSACSRFVY
jgi:hypothetical protein